MEQAQLLDVDALTCGTMQLSVTNGYPHLGGGQAQIPDFALHPAVNAGGLVAALMTNGLKALVGFGVDMGERGFGIDILV
jgi:hypothetical protein